MGHDATPSEPFLAWWKTQNIESTSLKFAAWNGWLARSEIEKPFPRLEIDSDIETVYIAFREERDGDLAKNVRRSVDACIDVDASGRVIGIELFDVPMPDENFTCPMKGDL